MIHVRFSKEILAARHMAPVEIAMLKAVAAKTLQLMGKKGILTVVVSGDAEIRDLNRQYGGLDEPTDVLAFPGEVVDPDSQQLYLGDVILSYPRAQAQAVARGHSVECELKLLVAHGVLHLLGHDHAEAEEKRRMWKAQAAILAQFGCMGVGPPLED